MKMFIKELFQDEFAAPRQYWTTKQQTFYRGPIGEVNGSSVTDDFIYLNEVNALFDG